MTLPQLREEVFKYLVNFDRDIRMKNKDLKSPDEMTLIIQQIRNRVNVYSKKCLENYYYGSEKLQEEMVKGYYYDHETDNYGRWIYTNYGGTEHWS